MFTIYQTENTFKLVFYTLGITEDMITKDQAGKIATGTIWNLIDKGTYTITKMKLFKLQTEDEIQLNYEEFFTFCILVDFTARCFVSTVFSERLESIHEVTPFANETFAKMKEFYLSSATKFFDDVKEMFKEEPSVLELIERATNWEMNDEEFRH